MPLYEFYNPKTKQTVEFVLPVARRDDPACVPVGFKRRTVPRRLHVIGFAENPHDGAVQVRRGLREMEEQDGNKLRRELDWTPDEMKRIWSDDYGKGIPDYEAP